MYQNNNRNELQRYHYFWEELSSQGAPLFAGHLLAHSANKYPHHIAIEFQNDSISYAKLFQQALMVSTLLHKEGISKGNRVMLYIENSPFFYQTYYGAWQLGTIVIPLNVFLSTSELAHIIQDAQPDLIIISQSLVAKLEGIENLPKILPESDITSAMIPLVDRQPPISADTLLNALEPQKPAIILYTSGTTGFPKGVMLSSQGIIANICQILSRITFSAQEKILCPLPLFHSFTQSTCVWGAIAIGATVILIPKITRSALMEGIHKQPTIVLGIPALYGILCKLKHISFPKVRYFICGGEALTTNIRRFFSYKFGRTLVNGYGLTEAGPVIAADLEDFAKPTHTIGKPLVQVTCDIRDQDQQNVGTLWVSGPNVMLGYFNAPEATNAILQDGWLNTGDMAKIDSQGMLIIGGREKDIIIQKGIKIYPQEIETVLCTHPQVLLAAVIGDSSEKDGELPIAYVQLMEGSSATSEELRKHCEQHLALYKVPRRIYIRESLPMTRTGKVDKKQLRNKEIANESEKA